MPSRLLSGLIFALITLGVQGARDPFDENKALHTNTNAPKSTHSRVALLTPYGQIAMKLLHSNAPKAAAAVWDLAEKGTCSDCRFYRAEARPNFSLLQDATGPPYALLQGQMSLPEPVQPEGSLPVK